MANRQIDIEYKYFMFRIVKSHDKKDILVFKHYKNEDGYEIEGKIHDSFPATGKYRYTMQEAADFIKEHNEKLKTAV